MEKINYQRLRVEPEKLRLDTDNPRFGLKQASSMEEALALLVKRAKLSELWNSITSQGWLDLEPMVCVESKDESGYFIVLEGNRRLASIKALLNPDVLEKPYRSRVPVISEVLRKQLERIEIVVVEGRRDVDAFIGFKHVNGPASWGSLPKAKFATSWYRRLVYGGEKNDEALDKITRALGETTGSSMLRIIVGYEVLEQAISLEFVTREQVEDSIFDFSHLYTMMPNPATRYFLGWGRDALNVGLVRSNPVPDDHIENLKYLIGWLFGTEGVPKIISAQGADRPKLQKVLAHNAATETLINTGNFEQAAAKAGLDVDSWRSRLIKSEEQAKGLLMDFSEIQSRLEEKHVQDAINRSSTLKSTYNTLLVSLKTDEN